MDNSYWIRYRQIRANVRQHMSGLYGGTNETNNNSIRSTPNDSEQTFAEEISNSNCSVGGILSDRSTNIFTDPGMYMCQSDVSSDFNVDLDLPMGVASFNDPDVQSVNDLHVDLDSPMKGASLSDDDLQSVNDFQFVHERCSDRSSTDDEDFERSLSDEFRT